MAVSDKPRFIKGIWGPYYSAMLENMWLTEGGQSATGALIDYIIFSHSQGNQLAENAKKDNSTVYEYLNKILYNIGGKDYHKLTKNLHIYPDFHGNRSPYADQTLKGMICGLTLKNDLEYLALIYLATIQAIAHETKNIIDKMNKNGYNIKVIFACGGGTKNPIFLQQHSDITGCKIALSKEKEAVLLGSSILAATAAGKYSSLTEAMENMSRIAEVIEPNKKNRAYHDAKHRVYLKMHDDQLKYLDLMKRIC